MLTQDLVRSLFNYNPDTGELSYINKSGRGKRKDKKVGCISTYGYLTVWVGGSVCQLHRVVWVYVYGQLPFYGIDHINGDRLDNRILNLRDVDQSENTKNRRKSKNNTSGFNGVFWDNKLNKWRARVSVNKSIIYLGSFTNKDDAIAARIEANIKYGYHKNHGNNII